MPFEKNETVQESVRKCQWFFVVPSTASSFHSHVSDEKKATGIHAIL